MGVGEIALILSIVVVILVSIRSASKGNNMSRKPGIGEQILKDRKLELTDAENLQRIADDIHFLRNFVLAYVCLITIGALYWVGKTIGVI